MRILIPKITTYILLFAIVVIGVSKVITFLSTPSDEEKLRQDFQNCGIDEDLRRQLDLIDQNKFILAVVGDGVKDDTFSKLRAYSSNYAQGWDLYEGVNLASKNKLFEEIYSKYIHIVSIDDGGEDKCAELISQEIIKSPKVIGVIGHATSATTKIALENYRKANIPFIIPTATNPALLQNCKNCFRLPSNDTIQAKAIADFAIKDLKGENIYLVWDKTVAAKDYSEYLQNEISNLLGSKIKFRQSIEYRPMNYDYLLKSISLNNTDVLIFCGYGSMAREFFNGLRFEYMGNKEGLLKKPKVILSDGNKISDIKEVSLTFGFDTYLSFPSGKLKGITQFKDYKPETPPKEQEKMMFEESFEIFGYDALTLFSLAFRKCQLNKNISRQALNEALKSENASNELCYTYKFEKGENVNSRYFIYAVNSDFVIKSYEEDYLSKAFKVGVTPKLISEFAGSYGKVTDDEEKAFLDNLAIKLKNDLKLKALIAISFDKNMSKEQINSRLSKISNHLVNFHKIEAQRILLYDSQGDEEQTRFWLVPEGALPEILPKTYNPVKIGDLTRNSSLPK